MTGARPVDPSCGHRVVPHTADLIIEAWAVDRAACIAEAVTALSGSFADASAATSTGTLPVSFDAIDAGELLAAVLEEVIFLLETSGLVAVGVDLEDADDGSIDGTFLIVPLTSVTQIGPAPKGIARSDLLLTHGTHGWRAHAIVDV